jgi:signal transduction histidine kinase
VKFFNILRDHLSFTFAVAAFTIPSAWIASVYGYYFFISSSRHVSDNMTIFLFAGLFIASILHSIHFGLLERFGIPAFYKDGIYINKLLKKNYFLKNSAKLTNDELLRLYNALSNFSRVNGNYSFLYLFLVITSAVAYSGFLWDDFIGSVYLDLGEIFASIFYAFYAHMLTDSHTLNVRTKLNEILYARGISNHHKYVPFNYLNLSWSIILVGSMIIIAFYVLSHHSLISIIFFILITFLALELFYISAWMQIKRSYSAINKATRQLTSGGRGRLYVDFKVKELNTFSENYNKAADELYSIRKSLEETVKNRTDEIEQQKEELAALNAAKDKLFTIIAHDLRNSFSALIGTSRMLLEDYDSLSDSDKHILVSEISKATGKSYHLLENLLSWANFHTGNMKLNFEAINLRELAEEAAGLQYAAAAKKKIKIVNNVHEDAQILADRFLLSSVVRNLINNAVKFTDRNGKITVNFLDAEEFCDITVQDTGEGMTQDAIIKILGLNTFYTTAGTDGEVGSGLGLKMGREFIERMGGQMLIESKSGSGSKFILRFPKRRI